MFVVTKRFGRSESRLKDFNNKPEAIQFIYEKLYEDKAFKIVATYGLYEWSDLIREYTQADVLAGSSTGDEAPSGSGEGASQKTSFNPTPFNNAPRPSGMPHSWVKDEDDKKK